MPLPGAAYAATAAAPSAGGFLSAAGSFIGSNAGNILNAGLGAAGSLFGAKSASRQAKKAAREERAWLERMSNTAHQREVADLRAAGLNPILSAGGSGASTPSAGAADVFAPDIVEGASRAVSTGQQAKTAAAQRQLLKSQVDATNASARQANAMADQTTRLTPYMEAEAQSRTVNNQWNTALTITENERRGIGVETDRIIQNLRKLDLSREQVRKLFYDAASPLAQESSGWIRRFIEGFRTNARKGEMPEWSEWK